MHSTQHATRTEESDREALDAQIRELQRRSQRLSWARLLIFAGAVAVACTSLSSAAYWGSLGCLAAVFVGVFAAHQSVLIRKEALERKALLAQEKERRQRSRKRHRKAPDLAAEGSPLDQGFRLYAPEPPAHALDDGVVDDLSLAASADGGSVGRGPSTLFAFLDASSTVFGARRLLYMIRHPLRNAADVAARQEAVREIAGRPEVCARLLEALLPLREIDLRGLIAFFAAPLAFARRLGLVLWADLMGTVAPALLILSIATGDPRHVALFVLAVVVNVVTLGLRIRALNLERSRVRILAPMIEAWLQLLEALRVDGSTSSEWSRARSVLEEVSPALMRLRSRVGLLQLHEFGILFELFNFLTLWELRILPRASKLIDQNRDGLLRALGVVGEIEALVSLSLPLSEQPDFELPEVLSRDSPALVAEEIGHPLLDATTAVRNSVSLGDATNVLVVTGSNMAGKSTYLRSVGSNVVLAGMGGPVCARKLRWTPVDIHTDVNVRDSLDDGKSYFKVEVERVRQAILAAEESPFVLILFDELFRGTNSTERRAAARAIVRYLRDTGGLSVVATHDHAMTTLASEAEQTGIENRHFQETIDDAAMSFDYRLRDGPATTRNAIRLLEISGYPEAIVREARAEAT